MENVVEKIYEKYNTRVIDSLSDDEFYQYYYNLLETGTTYCQFYNRKLLKEVDEEWVKAIEEAVPHIQAVVDSPRRFIEEDRQIVSVAVAKNFSAESIKHLSQHSEMVNNIKGDGTVEPNKVLNVFKEESLNTYENRFIYTLLAELRNFVNKRVDKIFDQSRDEDGVKLDMESVVDNYTELISYKFEMKIRQKQSDSSNDEENANIFGRITRIHKSINDMADSGFSLEMKEYPIVKHPVVKTNAIAKNPHYKACYDLWNFIHAYDRIGFKVEIMEQDPTVTRKFESDIYNLMLMDYVVVRDNMINMDLINIDKDKRKKMMGFNTIKQLVREIVDENDMPASELKNILLRELENAQKNKENKQRQSEKLKKRAAGDAVVEENNSWDEFKAKEQENIAKEEEARKLAKQMLRENKKRKKHIFRGVKSKAADLRKEARIYEEMLANKEELIKEIENKEKELSKQLDETKQQAKNSERKVAILESEKANIVANTASQAINETPDSYGVQIFKNQEIIEKISLNDSELQEKLKNKYLEQLKKAKEKEELEIARQLERERKRREKEERALERKRIQEIKCQERLEAKERARILKEQRIIERIRKKEEARILKEERRRYLAKLKEEELQRKRDEKKKARLAKEAAKKQRELEKQLKEQQKENERQRKLKEAEDIRQEKQAQAIRRKVARQERKRQKRNHRKQ